jgi:predicted component of type VI protein secretion system
VHNLYTELEDALRERLAVIADRALYERDPAAHLEKLKAASERITQLAAALPRPVPGDFSHYLQRQSYQKALDWIVANKV